MEDCDILLVEDNPTMPELTRIAFEEEQHLQRVRHGVGRRRGAGLPVRRGRMTAAVTRTCAIRGTAWTSPEAAEDRRPGGSEAHPRGARQPRAPARYRLHLVEEDEDVVSSYKLGANAYVRKPVDHNQFVEAAKTLGLSGLCPQRAAARGGARADECPPPGLGRGGFRGRCSAHHR